MNGLVDFFTRTRPATVDAMALAVDAAMARLAGPVHRCGDWCTPYNGPIVQGRRDPQTLAPLEEVTGG